MAKRVVGFIGSNKYMHSVYESMIIALMRKA